VKKHEAEDDFETNMQLSTSELELGIGMIKTLDRPDDSELRVLMFTATYFVLDGVTLTIRRLESHMRSVGAQVRVVTTVPEDVEPEHLQNVIRVPGIKIPWDGGYSFGVGLDDEVLREIERFNPNLIHFTVPDFVALDGIRWCQRNNVAYIATWHSNLVDYMKYYLLEWIIGAPMQRYMKGFYEQIPTVYVPTPYIKTKMEREGFGAYTELSQWGRGCDLKIFRPDRRSKSFRAQKGVLEEDVIVLWVGRMVPEKRPDVWLSVVKRLQAEGVDVKPMVVGGSATGPAGSSLRDIKDLIVCGWLSGIALAEAYASADILLFPSAVETFGNVTLESIASGCPAVVEKNCSGHLIDDGKNGYCCPEGDYEAFYRAVKTLALDRDLRKAMGEYARESAWRFERTKIMKQMMENYKDAIVKHKDPTFIKRHLAKSPEAEGKNILTWLCCDYWLVKAIAEPFLRTSVGIQHVYTGAQECVSTSRNRLSCHSLASMDYSSLEGRYEGNTYYDAEIEAEEEKKGRMIWQWPSAVSNCGKHLGTNFCFSKGLHYATVSFSYLIIFFLAYASFSVND